jgi:hypothetical protein
MTESEIEIKLESLKELIETRLESMEEAKELQAVEYARRLELLNNEAERLRCMQSTYLPREVFDVKTTEISSKLDELRLFRASLEGKASQTSVFVAWGFAILGIIIGILGLVTRS